MPGLACKGMHAVARIYVCEASHPRMMQPNTCRHDLYLQPVYSNQGMKLQAAHVNPQNLERQRFKLIDLPAYFAVEGPHHPAHKQVPQRSCAGDR